LGHYQTENLELERVLAMARGYCAIGMESKIAEDGRQALEYARTERVVVWWSTALEKRIFRLYG
jgi:hypothetical protein